MPSVEIIAIGSELLLGEQQDTNTKYLAKELNRFGYDVYRTTIIGDNRQRISHSIKEALLRCDLIITTGGLGPTVDDPTRQAVADAVDLPLEFRPELWRQIQTRFLQIGKQPTKNNRKQAYIPNHAYAIENHVGTAPAFWLETGGKGVFCLPGVPAEMMFLFNNSVLPVLKSEFPSRKTIHSIIMHTAGMGESQIDELIADLERSSNPTVGLTAHPAQVDIRITAKAETHQKAKHLISPIMEDLQHRLGDIIYGFDDTQLSDAVLNLKRDNNLQLSLFLSPNLEEIGNELIRLMIADEVILLTTSYPALENMGQKLYNDRNICVFYFEFKEEDKSKLLTEFMITQTGIIKEIRNFISQPSQQYLWQKNLILNFIRCHLPKGEK